jgi:hypothetical protein
MAGTPDDHSTDEWAEFRLLRTEYIFILDELTHSKELAEKVVRRFLEEGEYDWITGRRRYRLWMIEALPGGAPSPYEGEFWRSDAARGIECKIDCLNSSARWTGPASVEWRARGRRIAEYRITMIWVSHGAMVDFLRGVGLLPGQAQSDEVQQELPLSEPVHTSSMTPESPEQSPVTDSPEAREATPAASIVFAENSEWPSAEQLGIANAPKQKAILRKWPDLCRKSSGMFNAEKVIAKEITGGQLAQRIGDVDDDTARAFLKALREWLMQRD